MNLSWIPPDYREAERIEADPAGYLEFRAREIIREYIDMYGDSAPSRLWKLFEQEKDYLR